MNKKVDLSEEVLNEYIGYINNSQKMSVKYIYIGVLIITTLFVWILSSWVPAINITVVAIVCFALLFFLHSQFSDGRNLRLQIVGMPFLLQEIILLLQLPL